MWPYFHRTLGQLQIRKQNFSLYLLKQWVGFIFFLNMFGILFFCFNFSDESRTHTWYQKALLISKHICSSAFHLSSELLAWNSSFFSVMPRMEGICIFSIYKTVNRNKHLTLLAFRLLMVEKNIQLQHNIREATTDHTFCNLVYQARLLSTDDFVTI